MWRNIGGDDGPGGPRDLWSRRRRIVFLAVVSGLLWAGILVVGVVLASQKAEMHTMQVDAAAPLFDTGRIGNHSEH